MEELKCEACGKTGSTVHEYDANPYDQDVNGIEEPCVLCDECYQNCCDDI